jgi:hypothetical protein
VTRFGFASFFTVWFVFPPFGFTHCLVGAEIGASEATSLSLPNMEEGRMSIRNLVRCKTTDFISATTEFVTLVETGGIVFPDGRCLELIKDDVESLALLDSTNNKFHQQIDLAGQKYVPPTLPPYVFEALILPTKRTDCASTDEMFIQIFDFFLIHGVCEDSATISTFFAFTSWFPEFLPVAPLLVITGTEAEARLFLQLLTCVVRHALPLGEINVATFDCIPMHLQPTLLINHVAPSMWKVLSGSNHPHAYFPNKKSVTNRYCMKAVFAGSTLVGVGGDATLNISCTLSGGMLPVFNGASLEEIAAHFQPRLLDYRLKHVLQVRDAEFDVTTFPIPLRMLARALGSCIVDAPETQADIVGLLERQGEVLRASRMIDPDCVAIEALLTHCHGENGPIRVGVNEIATTATTIMADRGETAVFESKRMGGLLRQLGYCPKRDSQGFAIHVMADVRRLTHRLARDHQVVDSLQTVPGCPECAEGTSAQAGRSNW